MDNFDKNVFINCPFDEDYKPLLKVLIYVIIKFGFIPRLAVERSDSAEVRLNKIKEILEECKFSIHDLSVAKAQKKGEYYRLNMPFELGLDFGCKAYHHNEIYRNKKFLILEKEKYSTQKALSDMAGADCKCHKGDSEQLVNEIRTWFSENGIDNLPSSSHVWDDYNTFFTNLYFDLSIKKFKPHEINNLSINEYMRYIFQFMEITKTKIS